MDLETWTMESKEGTDALFLYATEGILVADNKGVIVKANPSAGRLFGYADEELIGQKIEVLIPKRFSEKHEGYRQSYAHTPHPRAMGLGMELYGLKKDGSEFPVEISLSPYTNTEGTFVIAFIVDITQRKEAEEKLRYYSEDLEKQVKSRTLILEEAIRELEKTRQELKRSLDKEKELHEMKSRFVSMASHEFRTPLTTMLSSLSLVTKYGEQNDMDNQSRHVRKIKTSISNLTDILNDFLSVSRLEEGKVENSPEKTDLRAFGTEIVSEMNALLSNGQKLVQEYLGTEQMRLDPKLLKNILFNLLSNAIKFSPDGGEICLRMEQTETGLEIIVSDEGIGISKAEQKNLFERFFRARNATHIQGTGLGLSIVERYVKLMHGTIRIESKENEGTRVILHIPAQ